MQLQRGQIVHTVSIYRCRMEKAVEVVGAEEVLVAVEEEGICHFNVLVFGTYF